MGCSTSKLEPEDQLDAAAPAPAKPPGRRGAFDLFGRGGAGRRTKSSNIIAAGGDQRKNQQQENEGEELRQNKQQQQQADKIAATKGRELARSPGSPSFRYYCENNAFAVAVAAAAAVAEPKKERR
uniref:Uncharacterized protein n=1 Tax=Leersia perrieri TaxID=77586 RepID=A0A0D9XSD9_9ORYZ